VGPPRRSGWTDSEAAAAGFDQFEYATSWYGAFVLAATPSQIAARLEKAFIAASGNAGTAAKLEALGLEVVAKSGSEAQQRTRERALIAAPIVS